MQPDTRSEAERALGQHLHLIASDIERWLDLFADDAVVEFPYAAAMGAPGRFEGKPAIAAYFRTTPATFRGLVFTDLRVHPGADPRVAIAEVHGAATIAPTGRRYEQDYVMVVHTRDGKISRYREYWNPMPAIAAFAEAAS